MSDFKLDIRADVDQVLDALTQTGKSEKQITKKVLCTIGMKGVAVVRRHIRGTLHKRSGQLLEDVMCYVPRPENKNYAMIKFRYTPRRRLKPKHGGPDGKGETRGSFSPSVVKAYANEYGAIIKPRYKKKVLVHASDGFRSVKEVVIPARPFFNPAINEYFRSGAYQKDVSALVDKELKKFWG